MFAAALLLDQHAPQRGRGRGAAIPAGACAQSLDARPGLWAEASSSITNGKAMPTIFDVKGGLPAGEKARTKQVMAKRACRRTGTPSCNA